MIDIENPGLPAAPASAISPTRPCWPGGDPAFELPSTDDEWQSLCLLYTSGTTGDPKGAVYSHRGAYLQALSNALMFGLSSDSVYLWTLPMFHCSGWSYPWAVVAVGGTQVCLRKVDPAMIFQLIARAPGHPSLRCADRAQHARAGAGRAARRIHPYGQLSPPAGGTASSVLRAMEDDRLSRHASLRCHRDLWPGDFVCFPARMGRTCRRSSATRNMARQGVAYPTVAGLMVADPTTMTPVPQRRQDDGRVDDARQYGDEGLPREP